MSKKEAESYARSLLSKGYKTDAVRTLMLAKGFSLKETRKAIERASKPKRGISLTLLLIIAALLIIILIPTLLLLTKDKVETSQQKETYQDQHQQQTPSEQETETYECLIDEECSFTQYCYNKKCTDLTCSTCEEPSQHKCQPLTCNDNIPCTKDYCEDNLCHNIPIITCLSGDGCCLENCSEDSDCYSQNLTIECETDLDCFDDNVTTIDKCISPTQGAQKECVHIIPTCENNDGVCPQGCSALEDNDCNPICGNNVTESTEKCDGPNCPLTLEDCNDNIPCTTDTLLGSASLCTAECIHTNITACFSGDNCCPKDCTYSLDNDCEPSSELTAQGSFTSVIYSTSGDIEIYIYESGDKKLIFQTNFITNGPEPHSTLNVYLAKEYIVTSYADLEKGNYNLGELKFIGGSQEYDIPQGIDLNEFNSVAIYSSQYAAVYGYAQLTK